MAHCWNDITVTSNLSDMKKTINVLVIEDNEYYNNLLSNALQQSINSILLNGEYRLILRSFTDAADYIRKIKSQELECNDAIVFLDYYLGNGINAAHIIRLLKEQTCDTMVVLLSQSKNCQGKKQPVTL